MKNEKKNPIFNVLIIGAGNIGAFDDFPDSENVLTHAHAFTKHKGFNLVGFVDIDTEKAKEAAKIWNASFFETIKEAFKNYEIDVLCVAVPDEMHFPILMEILDYSFRFVFIEKPIALDTDTATGYRDAVKDSTIVNAVGFQLRYSPLAEEARHLISGHPVTHVRTMTTTSYYINMDVPLWFLQRKHSGGPLLEQSIHMMDMARYLAGDITHVFARADRLTYPDVEHLDSEDTMVLAYRFKNGALGTHTDSCATTVFNWEIELFGPDWRLLLDFARKRLSGYLNGDTIEKEFPDIDLHMLEIKAFLEAVRGNQTDLVRSDFADATKTLATVLAGDRSIRTGAWEPVTL